ncbi:Adenylate cyclase, class 3 [Cribrihabitans marinus]|uniref:Adenylate cyclase, class 3 n=1 Tax=Cribrihabitans marinus TaxID=1227549 RepID=A0A1H7A1X3_9RHOB|nr:adenylate/guanylate cyclase domain-containing protein [Cribrihabitans marinus]GGH29683.1 hypothetical protein GCM10010973_19290 [Cribrihabitans marinus]SEJ58896.1 Adenylate cyclase, class 3 [Cribrihabitans marinus]
MPDIAPSPEIDAVVRRWLAASTNRNPRAVANLFSASSALTYVGSAPGEIWTDDALRAGFAAMPDNILPFSYDDLRITGYESGPFGWALWTGTMVIPEIGKRTDFRGTVILTLEDSVWRVVHSHNSTPVSNLESLGQDPGNFDDLVRAATASAPGIAGSGMASVMFTDIADSTSVAQAIGDGAWRTLVKRHVALVGDLIRSSDGTLVKSLGDGTMSTFQTARAALSAAQAIQHAISAERTEPRLSVRIGIHTGEVVEDDGDFFGTVVNKAARVAAAARPGEIRISEATRIMVGGARDFTFSDAATIPLKGLEGDHLIHRLEWRE